MKKAQPLLFILIALIFASCLSTPAPEEEKVAQSSAPSWYLKMDAEPGILIGYGEGESREAAADKARSDLAAQIEVQIKSESTLAEKGDETSSSVLYEQTSNSLVDVVLHGVQRLEEDFAGGRYYAAWSYDNRPMRSRALDAVAKGTSPLEEGSLKSRLPFTRYLENNSVSSGYQLEYRLDNWYLSIGKASIPVSRRELAENFFPLLNPNALELKQGLKNGLSVFGQKPGQLEAGQLFSVVYTPRMGGGFLNLFYVDNDGVTLNLIENQRLTDADVEYPDLNLYDGLVAEVAEGLESSTDMILAVESSQPVDFASFTRKVSVDKADAEEDGMRIYGILMEQLDAAECSSLVLRISSD